MLERLVRIYVITCPQLNSTQLDLFFFSFSYHDLRNGYETCDGLSDLARALIGLAFCMYRSPHLTTINDDSLQSSSSSSSFSVCSHIAGGATARPIWPTSNNLSLEAGPRTEVLTEVHHRSCRSTRLRRTMATTPHTYMTPQRALLRCVSFPSSPAGCSR